MKIEDELKTAQDRVLFIIQDYLLTEGQEPDTICVADKDELQSLLMWVAVELGYNVERTEKATHCKREAPSDEDTLTRCRGPEVS